MKVKTKLGKSSGLRPTHSFDLWGVLLDQNLLGERKIEIYKQQAGKNQLEEDEVRQVLKDYRDFLDGKPWATGSRRSDIIDALDSLKGVKDVEKDFARAFMQDTLKVMEDILEAGEGVIIFTSKPAPGLREQLSSTLGRTIGEVRVGDKGDPGTFKSVYELERQQGNRLISHTADELPELVAANKSGLFPSRNLVYVNRNESNSKEKVQKAGIDWYVEDLRDVDYLGIPGFES